MQGNKSGTKLSSTLSRKVIIVYAEVHCCIIMTSCDGQVLSNKQLIRFQTSLVFMSLWICFHYHVIIDVNRPQALHARTEPSVNNGVPKYSEMRMPSPPNVVVDLNITGKYLNIHHFINIHHLVDIHHPVNYSAIERHGHFSKIHYPI